MPIDRFHQISMPNEDRRNYTALYNTMPLAELQQRYPYMQWLEYIRNLMHTSMQINENDVVINMEPSFFEKFGEILAATPKRVIANYLMQRVVTYAGPFLTDEIRQRRVGYLSALSGVQSVEARWKECISITSSS